MPYEVTVMTPALFRKILGIMVEYERLDQRRRALGVDDATWGDWKELARSSLYHGSVVDYLRTRLRRHVKDH